MFQFGVRFSYIQLAPMDVEVSKDGRHFIPLMEIREQSPCLLFFNFIGKMGDKFKKLGNKF